MICAKCGADLPNGFRFCFKCGAVYSRPGETREQTIDLARRQYSLYQQIIGMTSSEETAPAEFEAQAGPEVQTEPEVQAEPEVTCVNISDTSS